MNTFTSDINYRIDLLIGAVRHYERAKYIVKDLEAKELDTVIHEKQMEYWNKQISKQRYHINKQLKRVVSIT